KDPSKDRGRFGVGKLSPYALGIERMVVETSTGRTATRLTFYDDGCACDPDAPILTCPGPITVECADVCGTPADDPQLAEWWASLSIVDCDPDPDVSHDAPPCFPLGTTTVTWTVTDGNGNASQCSSDVTVVDNTPPDITVNLNRYVLWPPNHKMADIHATVDVTDACCENPTFRLVSATSNEPDNGKGDGNTINDIVIVSDTHLRLRSERSGKGEGRIYTLTYEVEDCAGNTTLAVAEVRVPHDHAGWACASTGFGTATVGFEPTVDQFVLVVRSTPAEYETAADGSQVLIREAFDARTIDLSQAYVGNLKGVVLPGEKMEIDNNGDGLKDLALFYPAGAVNMLIVESTPTEEGRIADDTDYGTIGLHFTGMDGVDYLVPNI
ncbi:MAG: hypothetical protein JJ992_14670, partial [Planctomycetes bacterium]|nr:hypothetical protein [Planctomycetota bacterium]